MKIKPVRGTHDLFGKEVRKLNLIISEVKEIARKFGFDEMITPIFENSELFKKPLGEQSDVVLKEMYTFKDRNEDELTLRPEYTTPMIRAAISNGLLNNLPAKFFGTGQMFRRERPQKGRYRQFNQINFENFGTDDSFADIEMINLANQLLDTNVDIAAKLTKREFEIFIAIAMNKSRFDVADELGLSAKTVSNALTVIKRKLDAVPSQFSAIAAKHGYIGDAELSASQSVSFVEKSEK